MRASRVRSGIVWLLLAGLAIALRTIGLAAPFGADNLGTAGAFFSIAARNYLRYGYLARRLVPIVTGEGPPSPPIFYTHHPPLVPLLVSASFAFFGEHEWAARLVPLIASLVSLALLAGLAARHFGERVALLTLAIASTLPLDAHLAAHVDVQGSVVLACALATIACVGAGRRTAALACFTLCLAADWAALYLPILFVAAPWPFAHRRPWRFLTGWVLYAVVLFAAMASWLSSPAAVLDLVRERALSWRSDQGVPFDATAAIRLIMGTYLWQLCTAGVLFALVVWTVWRVPVLLRRRDPERLALLLLLFGVVHMVVGFQGARQHEFWAHYLRPGVPLACALLVARITAAIPTRWLRATMTAILVAELMIPGAMNTVQLATHPLSARMVGAGYTPRDLAEAVRRCTPRGDGALTSDYFGESATFYYAERPLGIAVVIPELLYDRFAMPRYDPPGGAAAPYDLPSVRPTCFVMPRTHEDYFPALAQELHHRFAAHADGPFVVYALDSPSAPVPDGSQH